MMSLHNHNTNNTQTAEYELNQEILENREAYNGAIALLEYSTNFGQKMYYSKEKKKRKQKSPFHIVRPDQPNKLKQKQQPQQQMYTKDQYQLQQQQLTSQQQQQLHQHRQPQHEEMFTEELYELQPQQTLSIVSTDDEEFQNTLNSRNSIIISDSESDSENHKHNASERKPSVHGELLDLSYNTVDQPNYRANYITDQHEDLSETVAPSGYIYTERNQRYNFQQTYQPIQSEPLDLSISTTVFVNETIRESVYQPQYPENFITNLSSFRYHLINNFNSHDGGKNINEAGPSGLQHSVSKQYQYNNQKRRQIDQLARTEKIQQSKF